MTKASLRVTESLEREQRYCDWVRRSSFFSADLTPIDSIGLRAQAGTRSNDTRAGNDAGSDSAKVVGRPRWTRGD